VDISGEQRIPAPQQTVWEALNDPEALKASIPGCETVDKISDNQFTARVTMAIGPVRAKFTGDVTLTDIDPPNGYTITGKGSGGAAGFGKGSAQVTLTPDGGNATVLRYTAQASVGGKLAQIGQRLVDSAARKMADDFFTNFTAYLTAKGAATGAPTAVASAAAGETAASAQPAPPVVETAAASTQSTTVSQKKTTMGPAVWIGILAVAAALLIWFLTR
jgi:carbon monoxide dehydrogenase subunit G